MKTIKQFLNEQMICELSSDLLSRAEKAAKEKAAKATNKYEKAHRIKQAKKFKVGAKNALDKEMLQNEESISTFNQMVSGYNKTFKKQILNIKKLGGKVASTDIDSILSHKFELHGTRSYGVEYYDDENMLRVFFTVANYKGLKLEGFLEYNNGEYSGRDNQNLFVFSPEENHDWIDNIFVTIDGKCNGDGGEMSEEKATIVNDFINDVLGTKYNYMNYLTNK